MEYEYQGTERFLEGVEKVTIKRQPSSKQVFGCDWLRVLEKGLPRLAKMSEADARLWWLLVERMGVTNRVFDLTGRQLAQLMGVSDNMASKSLRRLRDLGLVAGKFMLSPEVVYKGQTGDYPEVLGKWREINQKGEE